MHTPATRPRPRWALGQKDRQATLARHILGMANHSSDDARRHAAGCGYIVVGAEPGSVAGRLQRPP